MLQRLATSLCFVLWACGGANSTPPSISPESKQVVLTPIFTETKDLDGLPSSGLEPQPPETFPLNLSFFDENGGPITKNEINFRADLNGETLSALDGNDQIKLKLARGDYVLKAMIEGHIAAKQAIEFNEEHPSTLNIKMSSEALGSVFEYKISIVENTNSLIKIAVIDPYGNPYKISKIINIMITKIKDGSFIHGNGDTAHNGKPEFLANQFTLDGDYIISQNAAMLTQNLREKYGAGDFQIEITTENDELGIVFDDRTMIQIR